MSWSASDGNQVVSDGVAPRMGFKAYPMKSNDFEVRGGFFQYNDTGTLDLFTQSFRPSDLNVASWDEGSFEADGLGHEFIRLRFTYSDPGRAWNYYLGWTCSPAPWHPRRR